VSAALRYAAEEMSLSARALGVPIASLLLCACAPSGARPDRRPQAAARGQAYAAQVLHCAPAEVPASLMIERAGDEERAAARFAETRSVVLTTLGLYLGTGRWAGAQVEVSGARPAREGSEDECRALRAIAAGRAPPSWAGSAGAPKERLAVAGVVAVAYRPAQGAAPPQLLVRLAALLTDEGGGVLRHAPAEVTAPYALATPRYQERGAQEVAQDVVERAVRALGAAMR
jgi:hypothetical protein